MARPTVATPVRRQEIEQAVGERRPELLVFTADEVPRRVEQEGDLFEAVR